MTRQMPLFIAEASVEVVNARMDSTVPPRLREVMEAVVRHLHGVVKEVAPTPQEWMAAIEFLTRTGQACTANRQEFILLSDVLGVSMLVDAVHHDQPAGATASTVLGPFYVADAPWLEHGADICLQTDPADGEPLTVRGRVVTVDGEPVASATLDVWQANDRGFYDVQQPGLQPPMNLRGRFRTDADGRYWFRSIKPRSYPIPDDGPVGQLLARLGRHPFRPAHLHFIVTATGFEALTTHVFTPDDPYLDSDAVFGVKPSLVRDFQRTGEDVDGRATWAVQCDFALVSSSA